jgi:hypothetical protein
MNIVKAFSGPVIRIVEGQEVQFPRLSVPEVAAKAASLKAQNVERVKRLCEESEVKGLEKLRCLHQAESEEPTISMVWQFALTPNGSLEIAKQSLKKRGLSDADTEKVMNEIGPDELMLVAAEAVGYPVEPEERSEDKKDAKKKK